MLGFRRRATGVLASFLAVLGPSLAVPELATAADEVTQTAAEQALPELAGQAATVSELVALEESATLALTIDLWRTSNEDLAAAEFAVSRNLAAQQAASAKALEDAEKAAARYRVAVNMRIVATNRLGVLERQLATLTVEAFMFADEARIGGFGNELQQVRDVTPNEAVAQMLLDATKRVKEERSRRVQHEANMATNADAALSEAEERAEGLRRAQQYNATFELLKTQRVDQIRKREAFVLEESEVPENLVSVQGFTVNASIAANLEAMLAAALEDEIVMAGWGYRSTEEQITTRLAHCGNSGDAIFDLNANSCSPPTAQPLRSEHEKGLAIDFTENGGILNYSSPAFLWLAEHAAEYGFFNLPTEAWHWSTTGH